MTRPITYDKSRVLEKATELFWDRGYEGCSINALAERTGLNKHSMYAEFGNKEGLFLACIDYYREKANVCAVNILRSKPEGISSIKAFLEDRAQYAATEDCKGCLLFNTVSEISTLSRKVREKTERELIQHRAFLKRCVEAAKEKGEIRSDADCDAFTDYLDCYIRGLMNKGKGEKKTLKELRKMNRIALAALIK